MWKAVGLFLAFLAWIASYTAFSIWLAIVISPHEPGCLMSRPSMGDRL